MLCDVCQTTLTSVLRELRPDNGPVELPDTPAIFVNHHETYRNLQMSAERFCYICYWLLDWIKKNCARWAEENGTLRSPFIKAYHAYMFVGKRWIEIVHFNLSHEAEDLVAGDPQYGPLIETFRLSQARDTVLHSEQQVAIRHVKSPGRGLFMQRQLRRFFGQRLDHEQTDEALRPEYKATSGTTGSAACILLMQCWLDDCARKHPGCERLRSNNWYPTRILDVHRSNSDIVKLQETNTCLPDGPYMTLSHSWGEVRINSLTQHNLDEFKRGITVATLPKTFVDAISLTRSFGIRYLWIDSLCIIQDMPSDWANEASRMDRVYRHSFCNIGAAAAANSAGGLFHPRSPDCVNAARFSYSGEQYNILNSRAVALGLNSSPLAKRGWVVQERWLSPRMLHFDSEQIFWECRTATACETLPKFSLEQIAAHLKYDVDSPTSEMPYGIERDGVVTGRLAHTWSFLVSIYSRANLTYATDKMVAFSGLAKALQSQEPQDEYIAGLWKKNFIAQLAWSRTTERSTSAEQCSPYYSYIAPSWSWASVRGEVTSKLAFYQDIRYLTIFVDHQLEYSGSDSTGQITSGWITLQGPLREMTVHNVGIPGHPFDQNMYGIFTDVREGCPSAPCYFEPDFDPFHMSWPEIVYCLPLFWDFWHTPNNGNVLMHALLLRLERGTSEMFSRIGVLLCNDYQWTQRLATPATIDSLSELHFEPERGYTVKII